jgi:hypothetical protein
VVRVTVANPHITHNRVTGDNVINIYPIELKFPAFTRWDEKAGLPRDAIRSQGSTRSWRKERETGDEED